jgi:hypothetical protein
MVFSGVAVSDTITSCCVTLTSSVTGTVVTPPLLTTACVAN